MAVAAKKAGSLFGPELEFLKKHAQERSLAAREQRKVANAAALEAKQFTAFGDIDHLVAATLEQEQKDAAQDQQRAAKLQAQGDSESAALISHESDAAEREERASAASASNLFLSPHTMPSAC